MVDAPHVARMRTELAELETKIDALTTFLNGSVIKTLEPVDQDLMRVQYGAMRTYAGILRLRLGRLVG